MVNEYTERLRSKVDAAIVHWTARKRRELGEVPDIARVPVEAMFDLLARGGKRWRAILLLLAYEGFGGEGGAESVIMAAVALELLQAYLLIHDDWMDGDETRRGGPSVPAMMRSRFGRSTLAEANAVLAGDFAAGAALSALMEVRTETARLAGAARELARVETEVVIGQLLDVHAPKGWDVERTYALKTAGYSVRGPVLIGALLAGAGEPACRSLESFARPLGVAFQLKDDLLGVFGDEALTGKDLLTDLRQGKRTALIAEAEKEPDSARRLRALGDPNASAEEIAGLASFLHQSGARRRVEARIQALLAESREALASPTIPQRARELLLEAVAALGAREN